MKEQLALEDIEAKYLAIVSEFAIEMLSINKVESILWHLAHNVVSELGFEDVVVYLLDEERQVLCQKASFGNKNPHRYQILHPIEIKVGEGVVGKAAETKSPVLIADTRQYAEYIIDDEYRLSELAVPMIVDGKVIGVIDSEHHQQGFFNHQHEKTLFAIASIAAIKIGKNQTLNKLQHTIEELEYSSKIQDTLFEIAELIFETDSLKEFYKRLHGCIARLTFAKNFYIALMTDEGTTLTLPYCVDEQDDVEEDEVIPLDADRPSITGYVLNSNKPLLIFEEEMAEKIADKQMYIRGSLPKAWLGVPFGDNDFKGIVVVQSYSESFVFQEKDKQLLTFVAKHIRNAIERMNAKSELEFLALHDPLTLLPNRILFADRVEHALDNVKRVSETGLAILFLDLDRFKQVNDCFGHHIGDQLLQQIALLIETCLKPCDTLCRLGGDEFAILIETGSGSEEVVKVAEKIIEQIRKPLTIDGSQIRTSTSIGCSFYRGEDISAKTLLIQADEAMYQAKLLGRDQVFYYEPAESDTSTSTYKIEREFLSAIENHEFYLEFQPIIQLSSGAITAAEGLVRWGHPEQGKIEPNTFIPELIKSGYMHKLDIYVAQKALDFIFMWRNLLAKPFRLNINISGAGFNSPNLMDVFNKQFEKDPLILQHLCLEITEQTIVSNVNDTKLTIDSLRKMGIQIALDDFGTGYSSLSYLHQFTFDSLKIDRAFISDLDDEKDNRIILDTIINLARSLDIKTVAEGIETIEQYQYLKTMDCACGQGFYMSRPIGMENLITLLEEGIQF